jgi:hypothetical protein
MPDMKEIRRSILVIVAGLGLAATVANAEFVGFGSVTNGAEDCSTFSVYHVTSRADSAVISDDLEQFDSGHD